MITFNTNSWHYKLARRYTTFSPLWHTDICSYSRKVFAALFILLGLITPLSILLGIGAMDTALWAWFLFNGFQLDLIGPGVFFLVLVSLVPILLIIYGVALFLDWRSHQEPGFIRQAYRSWKDKYCVKVEFK